MAAPALARGQAPREILYNGITLPSPWPPWRAQLSDLPQAPPYLAAPPAVINIDTGRQLFVDDFLIDESSLHRTFHQAVYHAGNPVLTAEREWEMRDPHAVLTGNAPSPSAMTFSDGVFFDPADRVYKMWYMAGYQQDTALAISSDGVTWQRARGTYLVPVRALSVRFRARFMARLHAALPDVVVPAAVWTKPWVVYAKPTVQGSALVLRYLARYVHRVAITDARLRTVDAAAVTFRYQDARARAWRTMTLPGEEFLRRFLQHVLPRGFHKVRYYGFWRPRAAPVRARLQEQLAPAPLPLHPPAPPAEAHDSPRAAPSSVRRCTRCASGQLRIIRRLARPRDVMPTAMPP